MYESFFGLSQRPFPAAPVARRYFPGTSIDAARAQLLRCLQRGEGPALVVGGPGLGKTLLLLVVADQLQEQFPVALLTSGLIRSRKELLQTLLEAVGEDDLLGEEADLRLRLTRKLSRDERFQRGVLLLVDEAHTLEPPLLDELRMLTNLAREGEPVVRLVLAGTMRLEEHVSLPELESLNQRLALRCYLECFDKAETADYVRFELAVSGGQAEHVFEPEAYEAIYRATDGVPRLINQVCDHALLLAQARGVKPVSDPLIQEAWAQLQQLPTPWTEPQTSCSGGEPDSAVIEFGSLEDEPEQTAAAPEESAELPAEPETASLETGTTGTEAPPAAQAESPAETETEQPSLASSADSEGPSPEEACRQEAAQVLETPVQEEHAESTPQESNLSEPAELPVEEAADAPAGFTRGSLDIQLTLEQIDQTWQQLLGETDSPQNLQEAAGASPDPAAESETGSQASNTETVQESSWQADTPAAPPVEELSDPETVSSGNSSEKPVLEAAPSAPEESAQEQPASKEEAASPAVAEAFEEEVIEDLYAALDARERQSASLFPAPAASADQKETPHQTTANASPEEHEEHAEAPCAEHPATEQTEKTQAPPASASGEQELQVHMSGEQVQVVVDPYAALAEPVAESEPEDPAPCAISQPAASPEEEPKVPLSQALREQGGASSSAEGSVSEPEGPASEGASPTLVPPGEPLPELEIGGSGIVLIDEDEEDEETEPPDVWPIAKDQLAEAFERLQGRTESEST